MTVAATAQLMNRRCIHAGKGVRIDHFAVIGLRNPFPGVFKNKEQRRVVLEDGVAVGCHSILYEGAHLEKRVQIEPRGLVGSRTRIGQASRLLYGAQVHDNVAIGRETFVGGFIADNCRVGSRCFIFGSLIHKCRKPNERAWDTTDEAGPTLGDDVIVGWGAILIGEITIGDGARIRPGAVVRRNVPPGQTHG